MFRGIFVYLQCVSFGQAWRFCLCNTKGISMIRYFGTICETFKLWKNENKCFFEHLYCGAVGDMPFPYGSAKGGGLSLYELSEHAQ